MRKRKKQLETERRSYRFALFDIQRALEKQLPDAEILEQIKLIVASVRSFP